MKVVPIKRPTVKTPENLFCRPLSVYRERMVMARTMLVMYMVAAIHLESSNPLTFTFLVAKAKNRPHTYHGHQYQSTMSVCIIESIYLLHPAIATFISFLKGLTYLEEGLIAIENAKENVSGLRAANIHIELSGYALVLGRNSIYKVTITTLHKYSSAAVFYTLASMHECNFLHTP